VLGFLLGFEPFAFCLALILEPLSLGFAAILLGLSPGFAGFLITLLLGLAPFLVAPVLSGIAVRSRIGAAVVTFVVAVAGAAVGIAVFPLGSLAARFSPSFRWANAEPGATSAAASAIGSTFFNPMLSPGGPLEATRFSTWW
jgi:hypothetical protein